MFTKGPTTEVLLTKRTKELEECLAEVDALFADAPDGIVIISETGIVLSANSSAERILSWEKGMLPGQKFPLQSIPGEVVEQSILNADGKKVFVEVSSSCTTWKDLPACIVVFRDITERRHNEEELRKMYRAVLQSPSIIMITDSNGVIESVNPKYMEVTGDTLADVVGKRKDIFDEKKQPEVARDLWRRLRSGSPWRGEIMNTKKSGETYWEDVSVSPVTEFSGEITHYVVVKQDITIRKKMEDMLRDSEERVRMLLYSTSEGIFSVNPEGRVTFCNPAGLRLLGLTDENDLLGKPLHPFFRHTKQDGSDYSEQDCPIVMAYSMGIKIHVDHDILARGESERFPVEYWCHPITKEGAIIGTVLTLIDISERIKTEEQLRASEGRFRATFDFAASGIGHCDLTGRFLRVNRKFCDIVRYPPELLLNMRYQDITLPEDLPHEELLVRSLISGEAKIVTEDKRYLRADGSTIWVRVTASLAREGRGKPDYFIGIVDDITSQREAEERLKRSEQQLADAQRLAHVGSWEWDMRGRRLSGSAELCRIFDVEPSAFSGSTDQLIRLIYKDDREPFKAVIMNALKSRESFNITCRIVRSDGTVRNAQARGKILVEDDIPCRLLGTIQDITEQVRVEQALRESQERFAKAFRAAPVGITITTLDEGQYIDVNSRFEQLLGYSRDFAIGRTAIELEVWENVEQREQMVRVMKKQGEVRDMPITLRTRGGELVKMSYSGELIELQGRKCLLSLFV